jgi:hypothetical protein
MTSGAPGKTPNAPLDLNVADGKNYSYFLHVSIAIIR